MPILQIDFADGTSRNVPLERSQPVSVGRHSTSDIQIDEDGVGVLHCRISWNRRHWEVSAASADGVEVNGTIVRHAPLTPDDLIRVGSVDLHLQRESETAGPTGSTHRDVGQAARFNLPPVPQSSGPDSGPNTAGPKPPTGTAPASDEIPLRPLTEDEIVYRLESADAESSAAHATEQEDAGQSSEFFTDEFEDAMPEEPPARESFLSQHSGEPPAGREPPERPLTTLKRFRHSGSDEDADSYGADSDFDPEEENDADNEASGEDDLAKSASQKPAESLLHQARTSRRKEIPRPGERDSLRSPLVLGLGGGVLALLLGAATLWFTIGRQQSNEQYTRALELLNSGQFARSAEAFQQILNEHPNGRFSQEARIGLGRARIGQKIAASPADWEAGLTELETFIRQQRDFADFDELQEQLEQSARDISAGAATAAGRRAERDLLETSSAAERLALQYAGEDSRTDEFLADMEQLRRAALRQIRRHEGLTAALAAIAEAVEAKQPLAALEAHRELLARWPDLESHAEVQRLLQKTLETEQQLVQRSEPDTTANTTPPPAGLPVTVLARHTRARTDEVSDGTAVFASSRRAAFGIDLITGTPVWRRSTGDDASFFPVEVTSVVPALLLYEAGSAELQLVRQTTGEPLWRLPLASRPRGAPLVHEGQIYLATAAGQLLQIDLHAGSLTAQLTFSQPVVGPPVLLEDGRHLLLPAEQEVLYLLSLRPLDIRQVYLLEHQAGAISTAGLQMGQLVLMAANDRSDSSRLFAIRTPLPAKNGRIRPFSLRIPGHVLDRPVLRGRQLFVTSSGERISAFSVTDDPAADPLTPLASYQPQSSRTTALHLLAGSDGQLWMSGTVLRRLQLEAEQIVTEGTTGGNGSTSQPLAMNSGQLLFGRRQGSSDAVLFSRVDAESLSGRWRVVLGAQPLLLHPVHSRGGSRAGNSPESASIDMETHQGLVVTDEGSIFRLSPANQPAAVSFLTQPVTSLPVGERVNAPLVTASLSSGRIAAAAGTPEPMLWIVNQSGRIEKTVSLPSPVECPPLEIGAGIVVPLAGMLRVLPPADSPAVEDFLSPVQKDDNLRWRQLLTTADTELLALDSQQTLQRLQFRSEPAPHLARVTSLQLEQRIDVPSAAADGLLYLAAASGHLLVLDAATLEQRRTVQLPAAPRGPVHIDEDMVFVEIEGNRLCALRAGDRKEGQPMEAAPLWVLQLPPGGLAGAPHVEAESVWAAAAGGTIEVTDRQTGAILRSIRTGEQLSGGVIQCGTQLLAAGEDGVLIHLGPAGQQVAPAPEQEPAP